MPVSRSHLKGEFLIEQAMEALDLSADRFFYFPRTGSRKGRIQTNNGEIMRSKSKRSKPAIALWTKGMTDEEIKALSVKLEEFLPTIKEAGFKFYRTRVHPNQTEAKEHRRRKKRKRLYYFDRQKVDDASNSPH